MVDRWPIDDEGWEVPVQNEEHSIEAAETASHHTAHLRHLIIDHIQTHGPVACEEAHYLHPEGKHQSVSSALNVMREHGVVWKVGKRPNRAGNNEWVNDLSGPYRAEHGLPPGEPEWRPPGPVAVAVALPSPPAPIVYARCTGCGDVKALDMLGSKYGPPQLVGDIKGLRLWEARCANCDKDKTKGMQAVWKEQS